MLAAELTGKVWNGEEEPLWAVRVTEQIKLKVKGELPPPPFLLLGLFPSPARVHHPVQGCGWMMAGVASRGRQ